MFNLRLSASLALLGVFVASGCGKEAPRVGPPTVPVVLKVTMNGKPIEGNVEVRLLPSPPKEGISAIRGVPMADGSYALETYKSGDGAPPGTYMVQLGSGDVAAVGQTIPDAKPKSVIIPNEGGEVSVDLEGTGRARPGLMPPPPGQGGRR